MSLSKKYYFLDRKNIILFVFPGLAAVAYLWFVLSAPIATTTEALRIYTTKIKYVRLILSVGYIIMWFSGVYAVSHLGSYLRSIQKSKEENGFRKIHLGLSILNVGMILWPLASAYRATILSNPPLILITTVIFNYLMVIPGLIGFYIIRKGSKNLIKEFNFQQKFNFHDFMLFIVAIFFIPLYLWLIFTNPIRTVPPAPGIPSTFYLSDPLIVLTIVIPAIMSWILGISAAIQLRLFKQYTPGLIYKGFFGSFSLGIMAVIFGSLLLQGIVSAGTNRLFQLGLVPLTLVIYSFIIMLALGFFSIARGIKKLTKIEEII